MPLQYTKIVSELSKLNISEKEILVYLNLRRLGESRLQSIAEFSNMNHVTASNYLVGLVEKNLVEERRDGKKRLFTAKDPGNLMSLIKKEKEKLLSLDLSLKNLISQMNNLYPIDLVKNKDARSVIQFEGDGAKDEILRMVSVYDRVYFVHNPKLTFEDEVFFLKFIEAVNNNPKIRVIDYVVESEFSESYKCKLDGLLKGIDYRVEFYNKELLNDMAFIICPDLIVFMTISDSKINLFINPNPRAGATALSVVGLLIRAIDKQREND